MPRALTNLSDGTFSLMELREKIRPDDPHHPITSLVCIENTHNKCGGVALPEDWIRQVSDTEFVRIPQYNKASNGNFNTCSRNSRIFFSKFSKPFQEFLY